MTGMLLECVMLICFNKQSDMFLEMYEGQEKYNIWTEDTFCSPIDDECYPRYWVGHSKESLYCFKELPDDFTKPSQHEIDQQQKCTNGAEGWIYLDGDLNFCY